MQQLHQISQNVSSKTNQYLYPILKNAQILYLKKSYNLLMLLQVIYLVYHKYDNLYKYELHLLIYYLQLV